MSKRKKKGSGKGIIITLVIITILLLTGLFVAKRMGWVGKKVLTKVAVEEVKERVITESVSASGKIYPEIEVKVASDVSGEIIKLSVAEGDSVSKGDFLAQIEPDLYTTQVERAEASVNSAKSNTANIRARIIQIEEQLSQANRVLDRNRSLFQEDLLALSALEESESTVKSLEAEVKAQEEVLSGTNFSVKSAEASLKEARKSLKKTNIYAPMDGVVSSLNVEKGERVVGTAQFAGTELMRISNFDKMELRVEVSENDIVKVKEGDKSIVEIDAYTAREFEGVVTQISNSTDAAAVLSNDQVTNYTVKIRLLKESYEDLLKSENRFVFRPGMSASADIETKRVENILAVPIQSVATREIADSLKTDENEDELLIVVFTVDTEGKISQKEVKTGIQDDRYIEIKSGVSGEDRVVSAPYREISKKLKQDQEVEIVEKEKLYQKKKS